MRISGWHIDGFGIFRDHEVRGIPPGLTVFLGPNEAGKTTLLAFIRQVLFGFPDEHSRERHFAPLRGGRYGGRLFVVGPDGDYVVERSAELGEQPLVAGPGGEFGAEADLARLLGPCDGRLFQTIFAFSLTELQDFATLDTEGVRERIFSAGIVGAGRSAHEAIEQLRSRELDLLAPGGGARINELYRELQRVEGRLAEARREARRYPDVLAVAQSRTAEIEVLDRSIDALRSEQLRCRKLEELWPTWNRRREAVRELAGLEPVAEIPGRTEALVDELLLTIKATAKQVDDAQRELDAAERQRAAIPVDDRLGVVAVEAHQLHDTLPLYRDRLVAMPSVALRRRQTLQTLQDHLRDLGADWDRDRLAAFDRSLPRRDAVRGFALTLDQAGTAAARGEEDVRLADERRAVLARTLIELRAADAALGAVPPDEEVIRLSATIRRLHGSIAERATVQAQLEILGETLQQLDTLRDHAGQPAATSSSRRARIVLWCVALGLAALSLLVRNTIVAPFAAAAALLTAAAALLVGRGYLGNHSGDGAVQQTVDAQLAQTRQDVATYHENLHQLDAAIAADARALGLADRPTPNDIDAAAERVARLNTAREAAERGGAELRAAVQQLNEAEASLVQARSALSATLEDLRRQERTWESWKRQAGLPAELTPQGVLEFFDAIRLAREALREVEVAEREARQYTQFILAYEEQSRNVLAQCGPAGELRGLELTTELQKLHDRVERDRELRRDRRVLDDAIARQQGKLASLCRERDTLIDRCDALFVQSGATNEASFRRRLDVLRRRRQLEEAIGGCDQRLGEAMGEGQFARDLLAELADGDPDRWRRRAADAARDLLLRTEARDQAIASRREAELTCRGLLESTAIADLELERAGLAHEDHRAVRAWRVAGLAEGLIHDTLGRFQRKRQPQVLAQASRLFAEITDGEYTQLLQQESGLVVIDRNGSGRGVAALSRGTAEQLYLCIRLGLAQEFARHAAALPLVMDDVLVNFDPERARSVARALVDVAAVHQVLLFTCHPDTAEILCDAYPGCGLYTMERYGGRVAAVTPA
ncbi:MAG TPA: AAA family ATPase [Thermomicrobiaceae bacterium]|nr:AAA family ATPase [Thermomicrobiaceae bacterium]